MFQDSQRLLLNSKDHLETTRALLRCYSPKHEFKGDHLWGLSSVEDHSRVLSGQKLPVVAFAHR